MDRGLYAVPLIPAVTVRILRAVTVRIWGKPSAARRLLALPFVQDDMAAPRLKLRSTVAEVCAVVTGPVRITDAGLSDPVTPLLFLTEIKSQPATVRRGAGSAEMEVCITLTVRIILGAMSRTTAGIHDIYEAVWTGIAGLEIKLQLLTAQLTRRAVGAGDGRTDTLRVVARAATVHPLLDPPAGGLCGAGLSAQEYAGACNLFVGEADPSIPVVAIL